MARPAKQAKRKLEPDARSLAALIDTAPLLSRPKETQKTVTAWLAAIARNARGKAIAALLAEAPPVRALIEGLADGSPYLWELATGDADRLLRLLQADPNRHFETLLSEAGAAMADAVDQDDAMRVLRRMKA